MKILSVKFQFLCLLHAFAVCNLIQVQAQDSVQQCNKVQSDSTVDSEKANQSKVNSSKSAISANDVLAQNLQKLSFAQKVSDQQIYAKNIVGSLSFNIKAGDKDITVPGSLHMRKDQIIRLQLFIPLLGSEVGRIDFTPTDVLIVDRIHKQYIKADYNQIDFLQKQGLSFYSLQALFWNQLLLPGKDKISESDLKKFNVDLTSKTKYYPVTYSQGGISFKWSADKNSGRIGMTDITYKSKAYGLSTLNWNYGNFKSVGVKFFPATQNFKLKTYVNKKMQQVEVNLEMNEVTTDSDWDIQTEISKKYKNVAPSDALSGLFSM